MCGMLYPQKSLKNPNTRDRIMKFIEKLNRIWNDNGSNMLVAGATAPAEPGEIRKLKDAINARRKDEVRK